MARRPRLAVLGNAATGAQIGLAAERLGWKRAAPTSADLVYVTCGFAGDLLETARSGVQMAVDVDLVAELGADVLGRVVDTATGSVRRGEPLASAPAVAHWLRTVRETRGVIHLSGLSRSPSLNISMVAVALYAARSAGWSTVPTLASESTDRLTLRFATPAGTRHATLDLADGGRELPQWELQAASPDRVARVALLPEPRIEINGEETVVPADHPAVAFGHEAFLRRWWAAVTEGVPARHDATFVGVLADAVRLLSG